MYEEVFDATNEVESTALLTRLYKLITAVVATFDTVTSRITSVMSMYEYS